MHRILHICMKKQVHYVQRNRCFCCIGYLHLNVKLIGYLLLAFFHWVFVKLVLGNTTLSLYFLYNTNYLNCISMNSYAFGYPLFEK